MGSGPSTMTKSQCLDFEKRGGELYWKDDKCQHFNRAVCESVGGSYFIPGGDEKDEGMGVCQGSERYVESGEKIEYSLFGRRGLEAEELERVLEGVCERRWEECGQVVEVRMGEGEGRG